MLFRSIMGAGIVGALAYTYSDSFWYSAVEGEVYALSSFFTAIVFWAMLKWEHAVDHEATTGINADRWIIFIFFMMGLSIGVHLLVLLVIPALVMIYYYKRYKTSNKGTLYAFLIGCVLNDSLLYHASNNTANEEGIQCAFIACFVPLVVIYHDQCRNDKQHKQMDTNR